MDKAEVSRRFHLFPRENNTPGWVILLLDLAIVLGSLVLAYLLRFNFDIPEAEIETFHLVFPTVIFFRALTFLVFRTYTGILRYTSTKDVQRLFVIISLGSAFFVFVNFISGYVVSNFFLIPFSIVITEYFGTIFFMICFRVGIKVLYFELKIPNKEKTNVIIFGAGDSGIITKRTLDRDAGTRYKVIAFVDENKNKKGKQIEGTNIFHLNQLEDLLAKNQVDQLVISIQNLGRSKMAEVVEVCLKHKINVLNVPPVTTWINGVLSFNQIRTVKIEDLLGREPIQLDEEGIRNQIQGKVILITGAAGSIGWELVRQVARYEPSNLVLLDQAESALYELEIELREQYKNCPIEVVIGNIRSKERMDNVFRTFKPQVVFHAAAYKHVPMMENNPSEAVLTNITGTRNLADLSEAHGVERFVMVSTDKAVNPTNVMGASKRVAEIYVQSMNARSSTKFITTRFGNVLDSNGSVIPLFRKQIEQGGPVKVTHPEITRYFMTIPEACQLVLEAAAMGNGGEIFIFDMGKSVKIVDLAKQMIQLSGLELGKDIQIIFTGLRPGEKLYEELLADKEKTLATHNPQIMIAKVRTYNLDEISAKVNELIGMYDAQDNDCIVAKMKEIIPEYRSHNSVYTKLDQQNKA